MAQLGTLVTNFLTTQILPLAVTVILVGLVCAGFGFMAGKKARDWAKEHIVFVLIGAAIVYTSTSMAPDIAAAFGF